MGASDLTHVVVQSYLQVMQAAGSDTSLRTQGGDGKVRGDDLKRRRERGGAVRLELSCLGPGTLHKGRVIGLCSGSSQIGKLLQR